MKDSELKKLLKKSKCKLVRHGSNHDIWVSPITGKEFTVPRHKGEIKKGTAMNVLKDAGIER